jgi:D-alanine-D-alanine ligase
MSKNTNIQIQDLTIVLIADRTYKSCEEADIKGHELEMISNEYFEDIFTGLSKVCKQVVSYQSPEELINNIQNHSNDLVFTVYGGSNSRNRMALVPAVCESYNIKFAGADVYARIVCQDKFLSKEFAKRYNIHSPDSVLIDYGIPIEQIKELKLPLVVKPNFEGSSIGIDESSKVYSYEDAIVLIKKLQDEYEQAIIVEEFIEGKEVCICIVGQKNEIDLFEAMEVYCEEDENFFYNRLYTAKEKHLSDKTLSHRSITNLLSENQQKDIKALYTALGKMDYMRIDGRINANGFTLIELTPDGYMGTDSSFADAARKNKMTYEELLKIIIHNALESYHIPYSNYKEN